MGQSLRKLNPEIAKLAKRTFTFKRSNFDASLTCRHAFLDRTLRSSALRMNE
jgi:hypothetical protein